MRRYTYRVILSEWERRLSSHDDTYEWRRSAWVQAGLTCERIHVVAYQRPEDTEQVLARILGGSDYELQKAIYRQLNDFQEMGNAVADGLRALCEVQKEGT